MSTLDLTPTFLAAAGVPPMKEADGVDLWGPISSRSAQKQARPRALLAILRALVPGGGGAPRIVEVDFRPPPKGGIALCSIVEDPPEKSGQ